MKNLTVLAAICMAAAMTMTACGQTKPAESTASKTTSSSVSKAEESKAEESKVDVSKTDSAEESDITLPEEEVILVGGWTTPDSPAVPKELKEKLDKALEKLVGAEYEAVAYLGSQVVNGTNYKLLCRVRPVVPDAMDTYAVVTLYETLDGEVSITDVQDSEIEAGVEGLEGGWEQSESPEMTKEAKEALEKALTGMTGSDIKPVALLATQIVAGKNYCILCEITPVVPNPESHYGLVYVYEDLEGNASITAIEDIDAETEEAIEESTATAQTPNPFVDYATLEEAAEAAGMTMSAPKAPEGYTEEVYQAIKNELAQVIYKNGENRLMIRKAVGTDDISGDYNLYEEENQVTVGSYDVTMKGNDKLVSTAFWTNDGYAYAVMSDTPITQEAMEAIISEVA